MKGSSLQNRRSCFRILRSESEKRPFKSELQSVVLKQRCVDTILVGAKTTKESIQAQGTEGMLDYSDKITLVPISSIRRKRQ